MTRISPQDMARAVGAVRAMDFGEKKAPADEVFRVQPHMLASVVAQKELGVSLEKIDFLLHILLICFQAMKESGLTWITVTEDEQERQMQTLRGDFRGERLHERSSSGRTIAAVYKQPSREMARSLREFGDGQLAEADCSGGIGQIRHAGRLESRQLHRLRQVGGRVRPHRGRTRGKAAPADK